MISAWERELNKPLKKAGRNRIMGLENILSSITKTENNFSLDGKNETIRYIASKEFEEEVYNYVEPIFNECTTNNSLHPRFIVFSAPGATGKTALAKYICHTKNGIYWDLPKNKVAEYSFNGAVAKAVGYPNMSTFVESLIKGDNFFVIDAFDEAEAGSGRTGIEFFLRDLNDATRESQSICAILLARTESALFIKNYFNKNDIPYKHFEVGFFEEHNAKIYIEYGLKRLHIPITDVVSKCIDEQFREIKRILPEPDTEKTFLGYAPVLNALASSYDEERNTLNLLKEINNVDNSFALMKKILDDLLTRENKKFITALKVKIPKFDDYTDSVYNCHEQLLRMFGLILFNEHIFFADVDSSIPVEYHEEYLEAVNTQLPQHPFILFRENNCYDFTGTAFRDFVIAYSLSCDDVCDYVDGYLADNNKYCPSQMLIEFYNLFSQKQLRGRHIPLMYNSFKAHAQSGDEIFVHINGDEDDCSIEFNLKRGDRILLEREFYIADMTGGIYINQLSNCYIDVNEKVHIGTSSGESRIANSTINCREVIWQSEYISIEAYAPGGCEIVADKFSYITNIMPRFEIKTDDKKNLKISCPSINSYYKLIPFRCGDMSQEEKDDFIFFANLLRRIFSCLRSNSKDTPARKMDFIDNRVINRIERKKRVFDFLLHEHILYTDEQAWLYKLDTDKLSDFSIKWYEVRDGNYASLSSLYEKFTCK